MKCHIKKSNTIMNGKKDNRTYIQVKKNSEVEYIAKLIEERIKEKESEAKINKTKKTNIMN